MVDEQNELRRINWNEVFAFTHIFKSFRMAIHPSKLLLSFAAIALVFILGNVMDLIWTGAGVTVMKDEIGNYFVMPPDRFDAQKQQWQDDRLQMAAALLANEQTQVRELTSYKLMLTNRYLSSAFNNKLRQANQGDWTSESAAEIAKSARAQKKSYRSLLSQARRELSKEVDKIEGLLEAAYEQAQLELKKDESVRADQYESASAELDRSHSLAQAAITERVKDFNRRSADIRGSGVFASFMDYQNRNLRSAIASVGMGNITGGMADYLHIVRSKSYAPAAADYEPFSPPAPADDVPGFLFHLLAMWWGVVWLISQHWVFGVLLLVIILALAALFGGAVNRIAALHFAREEKISMFQALRFSMGKFFSFLTAPLIPLALIVVLGLIITLGGFLTGNFGGGIILGMLLLAAIMLGLVIAFLLIGLVAGAPLMYPTIAVEGSDSFDAISRSFSYVFSRPWRALLYGLVALVYGTLTYLFVRLFAYLALAATHCFVKMGVFAGGDRLHPAADKIDVLWQKPQFWSLWGPFNWAAMSGAEKVGAFLIGVWVFVVAGVVGAYLLSFLGSSTAAIYYLLRRAVDATDLDDVYVEEAEEVAPPVETAEAEETPNAQPPAEGEQKEGESPEQPPPETA